jgi:mannose-1-phosphate guanylyltransferase
MNESEEREGSHIMTRWHEPKHEWAIILAGGDGTRLRELTYEVSGDRRPKQFCEFFGGKSLLAHTRDRLQPLFPDENTLFVLNHAHRVYYGRELADVPSSQRLVQPLSRGTAPAIALAVLDIMGRDPDCTIAFFPSDHHYRENSIFQATIDRALELATICGDRVLMVGAPATYPEVEYGWIQPRPIVPPTGLNALLHVSRFWEKPNLVEARALQKSGCLWNTFVMAGSGNAFLGLLGATLPHLLAAIGDRSTALDLDRIYLELEPIDFSKEVLSAALERLLVLCDGPSGWTDFGSPQRAMDVLHTFAAFEHDLTRASSEPNVG